MPDRRPPRRRSAQRPSERGRRADPVRLAAYSVMRAVADGAYANLELPKALRDKRIEGRDAAFVTELVYGATRMRGLYDRVIEVAARRPIADIDGPVLDTLRLGVHQLLGMRVGPHAAVDESVGLARQVNGIGASGFVNAVLRRVSERSRDTWLEAIAPAGMEPLAAMAIRTSHPEWVVRALRQALLGHGTATAHDVDAQLAALLDADNAPPRVTLAARPGLADVGELLGDGASPGALARTAVVLDHGDPGAIAAVREGRAAVQDEGSQLVALALAAVPVEDGVSRERWLDLCAGPGGKAGLLAGLALERDADLVANEVNPFHAELVRQTLAAAMSRGRPGQITVRTGDGRDVGATEPDAYDRVIVDAPCTGLGALRRRPEARWRREPSDVPSLATLQRELLTSALDATRPGGVVAYATCSPHLGETRFVVSDVVKRRSDVELVEAGPIVMDRDGRRLEGTGDVP
jgi:16S rRNA (cytosine967-C5)-methyltransferase